MLSLPQVAPVTGGAHSLRLPRDHYVRLHSNHYSVHPSVVGRRIQVSADLARVQVHREGRLVADHARSWARYQTLHDPVHLDAAKAMRRERLAVVSPAPTLVEKRALADYDTVFGLDEGAL